MKRKIIATLLTLSLVGTLMTGCGQNKAEANTEETNQTSEDKIEDTASTSDEKADQAGTYEGQVLTVAVGDGDPNAEFYASIKNEFEEMTGATVNFESGGEGVTAELMSKSGYYDVLTMDGPVIPQYASLGYIMPLDDMIKQEDRDDFFEAALGSVSWNNQIYAMPYLVHGPVLYYRTDLFEAAGIENPPKTVEEYLEISKKLTDEENGIYGTIIEGQQSAEPVSQLMDKLLQFNTQIIDPNDPTKIIFGNQETKDAFEYLMKFYEEGCIPKESASYSNSDVQNMFLEGKLAIACNWPYMWSMCNDEQYSKVIGKVAVAPQPVTNAAWSWSFAVCDHSKQKDLAYAWCEWATSSDVIARFGANFGFPVTRSSAVEKTKAMLSDPADQAAFQAFSDSLAQATAPTLSTNFEELRTRVSESLNRITTGTTTNIDEEIDTCAKDLQSILDEAE